MHLLEQRGSGFARMRDAMPDHGLDAPLYAQHDGYFVVTFHSPKGDYKRLKLPEGATGIITPAVEAQLSDRQPRWCPWPELPAVGMDGQLQGHAFLLGNREVQRLMRQ